MRRREVILALGAAAVWPLLAHGQQVNKIPRVGVLWHAGNEEEEALELAALRQGFRDLGYIEGKDFALENRFAAERYERFTNLAAGLVEAKVDIIVAVTPPAARAAEQTTTTIPIVFVVVADPIGLKLVDSLSRPGRNLTGLSNIGADLSGKRMELLKDAVPASHGWLCLRTPTSR